MSADLIELAERRCPELLAKLREHERSLHLLVATLGEEFTRRVCDGETDAALKILLLLDEALNLGKHVGEFENALQISFVTSCDLSASFAGREVLARVSPQLRSLLA